jgi:hypothetical protein
MKELNIAGQAKVQVTTNTVLNRGLVYRIMWQDQAIHGKGTTSDPDVPTRYSFGVMTSLRCYSTQLRHGWPQGPVVVLDFASLYPSLDRVTQPPTIPPAHSARRKSKRGTQGGLPPLGTATRFVKSRVSTPPTYRDRACCPSALTPKDDEENARTGGGLCGYVQVVLKSSPNRLCHGLSSGPTATVPCVSIAATITYTGRLHRGQRGQAYWPTVSPVNRRRNV